MAEDYGGWCGGAPDLLLWRPTTAAAAAAVKAVEVKSRNDSLSDEQRAWLLVLRDAGVAAGAPPHTRHCNPRHPPHFTERERGRCFRVYQEEPGFRFGPRFVEPYLLNYTSPCMMTQRAVSCTWPYVTVAVCKVE
jgi:hypothetical protein